MSMINMKRDLDLVTHAIHAVFVYAACTEDGYVKIGISRAPFERIYAIHCGSPSPVRAAQWVWVGSLGMGREIEKRMRKEWDQRHTRGEWYLFDYSDPADKRDFHDTLGRIVKDVTRKQPEWERLGPARIRALIRAGEMIDREKKAKAVKAA